MRLTNSKLKLNENISNGRINRKVKLDHSCENHSKLITCSSDRESWTRHKFFDRLTLSKWSTATSLTPYHSMSYRAKGSRWVGDWGDLGAESEASRKEWNSRQSRSQEWERSPLDIVALPYSQGLGYPKRCLNVFSTYIQWENEEEKRKLDSEAI